MTDHDPLQCVTGSPWQDNLRKLLCENHRTDLVSLSNRGTEPSDWLFVENGPYELWRSDPLPSVLWITGAAGSGKSVAFADSIHRLSKAQSGYTCVLQFKCNGQHEMSRSSMNIACGILFQLTEAMPQLVDEVQEELKQGKNTSTVSQSVSPEELYNLISGTLSRMDSDTRPVIAIDALDESNYLSGVDAFFLSLQDLLMSSDGRPCPLKILLTTRDNHYDEIVQAHPFLSPGGDHCPAVFRINVSDHNLPAIQSYSAKRLKA